MKAVIFNGFEHETGFARQVQGAIVERLVFHGWSAASLPVARMRIAPCTGCFGCWFKTPGRCVLHDQGNEVAAAFIRSHLAVFFSPVRFGGYSPGFKRALSRFIQLMCPHMQAVNGQTVHKPRYARYPGLIGIGMLDKEHPQWADTFARLVGANAVNLCAPHHGSLVLSPDTPTDRLGHRLDALLAPLS